MKAKTIDFTRFDGTMPLQERIRAVEHFSQQKVMKDQKRGSVMLLSMRAGGVGMNLVAASSVFIADPWWNGAMEAQCINRIHRIGQKAPLVRVRKFIVHESVEEKIALMQDRKNDMATELLNSESNGVTSGGARPTLDDFKIIFK
eukprot:CAMPEP_0118712258 /NCGR_PEP_ID=MMETSP0800-20121206/24670_1 /TAXON_ID=210618 ORGANISM="Striatella unipunctata, Strain CCMP2910" /NCGR_SAMPLE_ID=MMETSP0800 /ASSEMBLY_ACC=CAM_ASM_000638 /LENGTH=144 /DNA_ID=CAMNT_0006617197 /DNA_START=1 /DNA_END=435 /DNA_ORIENTATION=-